MTVRAKRIIRVSAYYVALSLSICILMKVFFQLPIRNFQAYSVPLVYTGDAFGTVITAQNYITGGGLYNFPRLGAPFGWSSSNTILSLLYQFFLYVGSLLSSEPGLIVNLVYLISYPVTGITAAFALNRLKINPWLAFLGGIVYTFLPYHYYRNISHLWLALYFLVPFISLVTIWMMRGDLLKKKEDGPKQNFIHNLSVKQNKKQLFAIITCLILPYADSYAAYFAMIILTFSAIYSAVRDRRASWLVEGLLLNLIIVTGFLVQMLPPLLNGTSVLDTATGSRPFSDSEYYGLKIAQLLLPVTGHRIGTLAQIAENYMRHAPLVTENRTATLGVLMSSGFILSLYFGLFKHKSSDYSLESDLGILNIFIILVATIGGFGVLIAMFATAVIRCYNRFSIYIGFFSLVVILLFIQRVFDLLHGKIRSIGNTKAKKYILKSLPIISVFLIFAASFFCTFDQVSLDARIQMPNNEWNNDKAFIKRIELIMPTDSMIFELPEIGPQSGRFESDRMLSYDIWKPFIHSNKLRWSTSYSDNDLSDQWNHYVESLPRVDMINTICLAGFNGIYIDSYAYKEEDLDQIIELIGKIVNVQPIISDNGRMYFFDIRNYANGIRTSFKLEDLYNKTFLTSQNTPYIEYVSGWAVQEPWGRWSIGKRSNMLLLLPSTTSSPDIGVSMDLNILSQPNGLGIDLFCDGKQILHDVLYKSGQITFHLPASAFEKNRFANVEIRLNNPTSPKELGMGNDPRPLGIGVKSISFTN